METVTIAILVKDKAHCLPTYLKCILDQTFPKNQTYLYIRSNDNTDDTIEIIEEWLSFYRDEYKEVYFDASPIDSSLSQYKCHEWNPHRFKILGKIRQESLDWAHGRRSHYFVVDCDNFIKPETLDVMIKTGLPVVAPFLITGNNLYSNYHHSVDVNGYCLNNPEYHLIYRRILSGCICVDLVHCTYFLRSDITGMYVDHSNRHEYVVFGESLRKKKIQSYIDNREIYGWISFAETKEELEKEPWFKKVDI